MSIGGCVEVSHLRRVSESLPEPRDGEFGGSRLGSEWNWGRGEDVAGMAIGGCAWLYDR